MIRWNEAAKHNWEYTTHVNGKELEKWVGKETYNSIHKIFPRFDTEEGWQCLQELLQLFITLSNEASRSLGYKKLTELENEMSLFISKLEANQKQVGNK